MKITTPKKSEKEIMNSCFYKSLTARINDFKKINIRKKQYKATGKHMTTFKRFNIFNSLNAPDSMGVVRRQTAWPIANGGQSHRQQATGWLQCGVLAVLVGACAVAAAQNVSAPTASTSGIERREIRAQIKPVRSTLLSTEVPGTLSVLKAEGARVKHGDVLLALDCSTFEAQLKKTEVEIQASEQQEQVQKRLFELNSSGQLEWEQAQFSTKRLRAEAGVLQSQIRKCTVHAPHSGVITEARSRSGQYAQAGQALLELADDSAFEAEFLAPSAWVRRLRVGAALVLQVDELGASQSAAISRVADKVDPVSQSVKVTVRIQRPIAGLKAGMSGSVDTRSLQP